MSYARQSYQKKAPTTPVQEVAPAMLEVGGIWPSKSNSGVKNFSISTKIVQALAKLDGDKIFFSVCDSDPAKLKENPKYPPQTLKVATDVLAAAGITLDNIREMKG